MMKNPPHPGELLREDVIDELGLSVTEAARRLGLSRVALSRVINGKAAISTDLASRLEQRSEEHTSELQSRGHLVCRLLLEKKKKSAHCFRSARLLAHRYVFSMFSDIINA